jgi:hypothetical protein
VYRQQIEEFRRKFGRDMGPEDPFFFDPDAEMPQFRSASDADCVLDRLAQLMAEAGLDAAAVYAFKKTGGLLPFGEKPLSRQEREEWETAVSEYEDRLNRTPRQ